LFELLLQEAINFGMPSLFPMKMSELKGTVEGGILLQEVLIRESEYELNDHQEA